MYDIKNLNFCNNYEIKCLLDFIQVYIKVISIYNVL